MTALDKILYTGKTHTVGGREGRARSDDGQLDIALSPPGSGRPDSNPEQLFAAGWSACFEGAMGLAARKLQIPFPKDADIDAEVDLGLTGDGYQLQALVDEAHRTCPYSKATRGNIDVQIRVA